MSSHRSFRSTRHADLRPIAGWGGTLLALTYLVQTVVGVALDSRFERDVHRSLFWIVWYPLVYWLLQALTAAVALPKALLRSRHALGTWISPDRGIR